MNPDRPVTPRRWRHRLPALLLLAACAGAAIFLFLEQMAISPEMEFWFVARPPVPNDALQVKVMYPSFGATRITQFETHDSIVDVQNYYRSVLPKRGWYFLCSSGATDDPDSTCPASLSDQAEAVDIYVKDNRPGYKQEISVTVFKPGQMQTVEGIRLVSVYEIRGRLPEAASAYTPAPVRAALTPGVYPWPGADTPTPLPAYP